MRSYSSGVLKPDCARRGLTEDIFTFFEQNGLVVVVKKELLLNENDVKVLYEYCFGLAHYQSLCDFMMSGEVIFYVVRCDNQDAIDLLNKLVGSTNPVKSPDGTIRRTYGSNVKENVIHSTQNEKTFLKEVKQFLSEEERSFLCKRT